MTHECPAPGCREQVDFDKLMCPRDWARVPRPVQSAVWFAWRRGGAGSREHSAAIQAAIRAGVR